MLKQLSHSLLTSEELVKTAERLIQAGKRSPLTNVLERRLKKTAEASNLLSDALDESLTNIYASRVQQADLQRDDAFQAFKYGVLSASYRSEGAVRLAGETLVEIVRKHGFSLYNLGHIAQSEAMKNLMGELSRCMTEISNSGVADLFEEMVNANEHFNDVYHEKLDDEAGKETPQIVVGKREVSKQITLFLNYVELLEDDKEQGVNKLVDELNQVIAEITIEARERQRG
ncbi:MAG: hypothetical protein HRT61_16075 [Ekhidna sp.]|nr:hypothetical protein [Ekhidna sp.]